MSEPSLGKVFRVLVADDSSAVRELLFEALSSIMCGVTCVKDGLEALASLQTGVYDLLITDHQMPRLDGLALVRRLQTESCCPPSILITGYSSPAFIEEAKRAGAAFVLPKPVAIPDLLSFVESIRARRPAPQRPSGPKFARKGTPSGSDMLLVPMPPFIAHSIPMSLPTDAVIIGHWAHGVYPRLRWVRA